MCIRRDVSMVDAIMRGSASYTYASTSWYSPARQNFHMRCWGFRSQDIHHSLLSPIAASPLFRIFRRLLSSSYGICPPHRHNFIKNLATCLSQLKTRSQGELLMPTDWSAAHRQTAIQILDYKVNIMGMYSWMHHGTPVHVYPLALWTGGWR